jgi:hypothetical protein
MDTNQFGREFLSWITHIFPLLIAVGLFLPIYLFLTKITLFFVLLLITFLVSAILDKQLKKGFIIGIVTVFVLFVVNFMFWQNYVQMQKVIILNDAGASLYPSIISMFGEPLHPLIFLPLVIGAVFIPLIVVWFLRKKQATNNQNQ